MKKILIFLLIIGIFSSCSLFEDEERRTYYETEGVGYVYYEDTKEPVPYAMIEVHAGFTGQGLGVRDIDPEWYYADENGFFKIKFLKRYKRQNVSGYSVSAEYPDLTLINSFTSTYINYSREDIKKIKSNSFNIDTLWIR
ncbi:MAG: hypothetical protein LBV69_09515 [Bacteroidales bacterium]|jgi:hypothetical protein|nr:hypothetical protein [Bacteroidales bacterium]